MEGDTMVNVNDTIMMNGTGKLNCFWANVLDDDEKNTLVYGLILYGYTSAGVLSWLLYQNQKHWIIFGKLRNTLSSDNLFVFIAAMYVRTIIALFSRFDLIRQIAFMLFKRCDMLASVETFFAVFEVEALTHVCIERYVVAKYITKGWKIVLGHYIMYTNLCVIFAFLYAVPPLFGLGSFGCDFGCVSCTYNMLLPDTWQRYLISTVFFLRSFKPAAFMVIMLLWTWKLESKFDTFMKKQADSYFTKFVTTLTLVCLACWTPLALIRARVVLSQLLYDEIYIPSALSILWAMWIYEMTPILTTITILLYRHCPRKPAACYRDATAQTDVEIIANVREVNELPSKAN